MKVLVLKLNMFQISYTKNLKKWLDQMINSEKRIANIINGQYLQIAKKLKNYTVLQKFELLLNNLVNRPIIEWLIYTF